jgi:hypothetical protein
VIDFMLDAEPVLHEASYAKQRELALPKSSRNVPGIAGVTAREFPLLNIAEVFL